MRNGILFLKNRPVSDWLLLAGLMLLFVLLRWNNFNAPFIRDEGEYAYAAQLLIHGVLPYDHAFIQKPPMVVYGYALAQLLLPDFFWSPRLLAYLFVALTTALLGYLARLEFGKRIAWTTMFFATPMILLPGLQQFTVNTEMFMLLPLLGLFAVYIHARHRGQSGRHWFAAAFLAVTALCYKYTSLLLVVYVFSIWTVQAWRNSGGTFWLKKNLPAALLGGAVAVILELGVFLIHDGGARLWECTVEFNRHYLQTTNFGLDYAATRLETFFESWWLFFLFAAAAICLAGKRPWFWAGALLCAVISTNASCYGQYYMAIMPFWALLAAVGVGQLARLAVRWQPVTERWAFGILTTVAIFFLLYADMPWLVYAPERFAFVRAEGTPFFESPFVARRVTELSRPDDFLYVAGSEPQIYCYANRFSPTRFITAYALMLPTALAPRYQHEAIAALQAHPPKLIVLTLTANSWLRQTNSPPDFFGFLEEFLQQDYERIGGVLPGKTNFSWLEPLPDEAMSGASLVLYRRKTVGAAP